jgi:hypothetical protein
MDICKHTVDKVREKVTMISACPFNLQNDPKQPSDFTYAVPTACRKDATRYVESEEEWYCPRHAEMLEGEDGVQRQRETDEGTKL